MSVHESKDIAAVLGSENTIQKRSSLKPKVTLSTPRKHDALNGQGPMRTRLKRWRKKQIGDKFGESLGGKSGFLELLESPRTSLEVPPNFPGSFSAASPEVLSLWNLTAIQRFPGSFPNFPRSSPNFPASSPDFPGGQSLSLGSLTPSPDSQKLSLSERTNATIVVYWGEVTCSP